MPVRRDPAIGATRRPERHLSAHMISAHTVSPGAERWALMRARRGFTTSPFRRDSETRERDPALRPWITAAEYQHGGRRRWRRGRDSNPRYGYPYAAFRVRCIQPLCHLSAGPSPDDAAAQRDGLLHEPAPPTQGRCAPLRTRICSPPPVGRRPIGRQTSRWPPSGGRGAGAARAIGTPTPGLWLHRPGTFLDRAVTHRHNRQARAGFRPACFAMAATPCGSRRSRR